MNKEEAMTLLDYLSECLNKLDGALVAAENINNKKDSEKTKKAVKKIIGHIIIDLMIPISSIYSELIPYKK